MKFFSYLRMVLFVIVFLALVGNLVREIFFFPELGSLTSGPRNLFFGIHGLRDTNWGRALLATFHLILLILLFLAWRKRK